MDYYKNTFNVWNQLAQKYEDTFMNLNLYNSSYELFCNYIAKKDAQILELGCGPGNITKHLLNLRPEFKVLATDVAPNMIALASKNNPNAHCQVLDCRSINMLKEQFDGIVCGFCIPYLAKKDCELFIHQCAQKMNLNGIFYVSLIEGNYEDSKPEHSSDGKHTIMVHYYNDTFILKQLHNAGLQLLESIKIPYHKADGSSSTHLVFIAKK